MEADIYRENMIKGDVKMKTMTKGLLACGFILMMCLPAVFGQNGPVRLVGATPWDSHGQGPGVNISVHAKGVPSLTAANTCDWSRHKVSVQYLQVATGVWKTQDVPLRNNYGLYGYFATRISTLSTNMEMFIRIQYDTPNGTYFDNNFNNDYHVSGNGVMNSTRGAVGGKVGLWDSMLVSKLGTDVADIDIYAQTQGKSTAEVGIFYSLDNWKSSVHLLAVDKGPVHASSTDVSLFHVTKSFFGRGNLLSGIQFYLYYWDKDANIVYWDTNFGLLYELSKLKFTEIW